MEEELVNLKIDINNITKAQAIAIEDMFSAWQRITIMGRSRFVGYYVNGEEGFLPEIRVNDGFPHQTDLINTDRCWHSIRIKIAPTVANGLTETIWVDEADVYLVDSNDIENALELIEEKKNQQ